MREGNDEMGENERVKMTSAQVGINDKLNKEELEATNIAMGGDHKCPVCQATFTRPQHVARHMRSHTGDRPYKCQYCGDQFARSDLLSRHVNKCHANEKPLPSQGRRKGSASASRATTSKQACDQCVQSSLPCDGSNPCAKCVQRKCRCTFVKFHRQTAPVGPGHNPRPQTQPTSSSRIPVSYPPPDDFFLTPAPSSGVSMAETLYNSQTFAFPPLYPDPASSSDFTTKYRAQAELLRTGASSYNPTSAESPVAPPSSIYPDPRPSSWVNWGHENTHSDSYHPEVIHDKDIHHRHESLSHRSHSQPQQYLQQHSASSGAAPGTSSSYPSSSASAYLRRGSVDFNGSDASSTTSQSIPSSTTSSSIHLPLDGLSIQQHHLHPLSYNTNDNNQSGLIQSGEGGVSNAFGSMSLDDHLKSLAAASATNDGGNFFGNINMDIHSMNMTGLESMSGMPADDPDATPMPMRENPPHVQSRPPPQPPTLPHLLHHPLPQPPVAISLPLPIRSSSANAANGISNGTTPRGELGPGTAGGGADMRELKEFWKQYMRTPLSGPGPASDSQNQQEQHIQGQILSPSGYRRTRVASTPTIPQNINCGLGISHNFTLSHPNASKSGTAASRGGGGGGESGMRTTLQHQLQQQHPHPQAAAQAQARQAAEDLRSYEAAVLARKAPTNLNLVPKTRRGTVPAPGNGNGHSSSALGGNSSMSPVNVNNVIHGHGIGQGRSGTGAAIGVVPVVNFDSFRHQFGGGNNGLGGGRSGGGGGGDERPGSASTNVSNASSGSAGSGSGGSNSGLEGYPPSYQSHLQQHQQRQQQQLYNHHPLPHPLSQHPLQNHNHHDMNMNAYMMRRGSPGSVSSYSNTDGDNDHSHSSRASSVSVEGLDNHDLIRGRERDSVESDSSQGDGGGGGGRSARPSFKRLASQVLGPPVVKKRAFRDGDDGDNGDDDDNDDETERKMVEGMGNMRTEMKLNGMNMGVGTTDMSTSTSTSTEYGQGYAPGALGIH